MCAPILNLSDRAMEDSLYEFESMRRFAGLGITRPIPEETIIFKFSHSLERHGRQKPFEGG